MRGRGHFLLIPLAALLAVLPSLAQGPSCGHDFAFHLRSWLEAESQWRQGVPIPHWDFTAAWNSGEPRFIFYPPLSWTLGALLTFLLPWAAVPAAYLWLALAACGFTMHRLARLWTTPENSLAAAGFFMVHPYMLFTLYERAAYAELLAAAWIPLLMLAVLRPRLRARGIAGAVALLWLTSAPAAVMGCYALAILAVGRVALSWRAEKSARIALQEAATIAAGALLGLGLAAFYILPAAYEQRWVHIGFPFLAGVRYQDNFLFGRVGTVSHVAILRTVSFCAVALLAASGIFAVISAGREAASGDWREAGGGRRGRSIACLVLLVGAAGFLLTSPSAPLWRHVPWLAYIQFPWRICAVLGACAAALLALALPGKTLPGNKRAPASLVLAGVLTGVMAGVLALTLAGDRWFRQYCHADQKAGALAEGFYTGSARDAYDDYNPIGSDPAALGHDNPAYWLAPTPEAPAEGSGDSISDAGGYSLALARRLHFAVSAAAPEFLILSLRDYPVWRVAINGRTAAERTPRKDGLIALPIAAGVSRIDIAYRWPADQIAGWALTLLSIAAAALSRHRGRAAQGAAEPHSEVRLNPRDRVRTEPAQPGARII